MSSSTGRRRMPAKRNRNNLVSRVAAPGARVRSLAELREFQRTFQSGVVRPLDRDYRAQRTWSDGRSTAEFAASFIKPGPQLAPVERLEIYNRVYWFRLLDSFYEDTPLLRAALGERKFRALAQAYLEKYPSGSFTLRNLCERLPLFLRREPHWAAPHGALARDLARFEWAQTVAFDGEERPAISPEEIAAVPPSRLRLALQPYVTLLDLAYPVDHYALAVRDRESLRSAASNVAVRGPGRARVRTVPRPKPDRVWLAVHRVNHRLYYKRLDRSAFRILSALQAGQPLARALAAGGRGVTPEAVQQWFAEWMALGWLCRRA